MRTITRGVVLAAVAMLLGGCGPDAICGSDDYPVMQIDGTGRQCVAENEQPPAGFTRFPDGQAPKHVDDEWDVYWRTHTLDPAGKVIESR